MVAPIIISNVATIIESSCGKATINIPTIINIICFWIIQIPLAYFLASKTGLQEKGVYIAIVVGDFCLTVIGIILFIRGKWKLSKV